MLLIIPSLILFTYALYTTLDQLKIFRSTGINLALSIAIAGSLGFFFLLPFSSIIGSVSLFFICVEKVKGAKGLSLGVILGVCYFLFGWLIF